MFLTSVPNLEIKKNIKKQQEKEAGVPVGHLQSAMSRAPPGAEGNIQLSGCPASLLLSSENCVLLSFLILYAPNWDVSKSTGSDVNAKLFAPIWKNQALRISLWWNPTGEECN